MPIMVLMGQVPWQELLYFLLIALGLGILFIVHTDLQQVINAYSLLGDLRSELDAKDPDTLTYVEGKVLAFHRDATYIKL